MTNFFVTENTFCGSVIVDEVEKALKQMEPLRSPAPDSMPPLYFQTYWSLVGPDVKEAILMYLNSGMLPKSLGHFFITLIPKVKNQNISPNIALLV